MNQDNFCSEFVFCLGMIFGKEVAEAFFPFLWLMAFILKMTCSATLKVETFAGRFPENFIHS